MKKVMFALCFMLGGIVTLMAQEQQDTTSSQYRTETQSQYPRHIQGQDRERIQSTELPDEVKRALEGAEYRGWLVSGAFKAKGSSMQSDTTGTDPNQPENNQAAGEQDEEVYIVELKNGAETKSVWFDANGQVIEGMEGRDQNETSQYNQNTQPGRSETEQSPDIESGQPETETQPERSTSESQPDRP